MPKPIAESDSNYSVRVGDLVGNYRLERIIDQGGMGVVFYAVHKDIGRPAAVKILFRHFAADAGFSSRFLNEARAVNLIRHPGLVETFEFGKLTDETPYIIMEYLDGDSIAARLKKQRPSLLEALSWTRQIALAVAAGHEKGIIHRDLKPENIFLLKDPLLPGFERTKVLDFGIAKVDLSRAFQNNINGAITAQKQAQVTQVGMTLGSPLYMPPEQYQELAAVTDRGDVYSLGIILYELLAGKVPFYSDGPLEVMAMHLKNPPPPLRDIDPSLPESVIALVMAMLEKSAALRPSMAEVESRVAILLQEAELQALRKSHSMPSLSAGTLSGLLQFQSLQAAPAGPQPPARFSRGSLAAVGSLVVVLLVGFAVFRARLHRPPPPPAPPMLVVTPPVPPPVEPTQVPEPTTVAVSVTSDPPGARIICSETGKELGVTPATLELSPDKKPLAVVLRRSGFRERSLSLDRTQNNAQSVRLDAVPQRTRTADSLLTPSFE